MTAQTHQTENQRTMIINHLMTKGPLTVLTAIEYIGCYALSQRVGEIRREGFPIKSKWLELDNGKRVKQYYLES